MILKLTRSLFKASKRSKPLQLEQNNPELPDPDVLNFEKQLTSTQKRKESITQIKNMFDTIKSENLQKYNQHLLKLSKSQLIKECLSYQQSPNVYTLQQEQLRQTALANLSKMSSVNIQHKIQMLSLSNLGQDQQMQNRFLSRKPNYVRFNHLWKLLSQKEQQHFGSFNIHFSNQLELCRSIEKGERWSLLEFMAFSPGLKQKFQKHLQGICGKRLKNENFILNVYPTVFSYLNYQKQYCPNEPVNTQILNFFKILKTIEGKFTNKIVRLVYQFSKLDSIQRNCYENLKAKLLNKIQADAAYFKKLNRMDLYIMICHLMGIYKSKNIETVPKYICKQWISILQQQEFKPNNILLVLDVIQFLKYNGDNTYIDILDSKTILQASIDQLIIIYDYCKRSSSKNSEVWAQFIKAQIVRKISARLQNSKVSQSFKTSSKNIILKMFTNDLKNQALGYSNIKKILSQ